MYQITNENSQLILFLFNAFINYFPHGNQNKENYGKKSSFFIERYYFFVSCWFFLSVSFIHEAKDNRSMIKKTFKKIKENKVFFFLSLCFSCYVFNEDEGKKEKSRKNIIILFGFLCVGERGNMRIVVISLMVFLLLNY